jgi:hypothetical protein
MAESIQGKTYHRFKVDLTRAFIVWAMFGELADDDPFMVKLCEDGELWHPVHYIRQTYGDMVVNYLTEEWKHGTGDMDYLYPDWGSYKHWLRMRRVIRQLARKDPRKDPNLTNA